MVIYDNKPSIFEANGDGSYAYRWDIKEVTKHVKNDTEAEVTQYECEEVIVWGTVTSDKLTATVIGAVWPSGREQKLINEYNAALLGVYDDVIATTKIAAYKEFLSTRAALKIHVDTDCAKLGIK